MSTINEKKLEKWARKYKKHILIILLFVISIELLLIILSKRIDENFDIIRIDEGKAPYKKVKSTEGDAYAIILTDGEYEFSSWNKTGEERQFLIDLIGRNTFNLHLSNLNDSTTLIRIQTGHYEHEINIDIETENGIVDLKLDVENTAITVNIVGNGTVRITNISKDQISIIINGEKVFLEPFETYIWEG